MDIVATIAIYAAIVSTAGLLWQIYTWRKSQPEIQISARVQSLDKPDRPPVSRAECVCTIVNSGGHPASIVEIWADQISTIDILGEASMRRDAEDINLPLRLGPGECCEWRFLFPKDYGLRCFAKDALGRAYQCNIARKVTI